MDVNKLVENAKAMWSEMNTSDPSPVPPSSDADVLPDQQEEDDNQVDPVEDAGGGVELDSPAEEDDLVEDHDRSDDQDEMPEDPGTEQAEDKDEGPYEYEPGGDDDLSSDGFKEPPIEDPVENSRENDQAESQDALGLDDNEPSGRFDQENFDIWEPDFSEESSQFQPQSEKRTEDDLVRLIDESSVDPGGSPPTRKHQSTELKLPDDWQEGISSVVQQQMFETQEIVKAHLDDSMSRSLYHLNILGGG